MANKLYYRVSTIYRVHNGITDHWLEYHTGADRFAVLKMESMNRRIKITEGSSLTPKAVGEWVAEVHYEAALYEMTPVI